MTNSSVVESFDAVSAVIENYIDGTYTANIDLLRSIFHPSAVMSGYIQGNLLVGSPEPFFNDLGSRPSSKDAGLSYAARIVSVDIYDAVATVKLLEEGLMATNFVDIFHLIKTDNNWLIVSKLFHHD